MDWRPAATGKLYSFDLGLSAIILVESSQSRSATARLLNLGKMSKILQVREHRLNGRQAAKPTVGRRRLVLLAEPDWLLARIAAAPIC